MTRRQDIQSGLGTALDYAGYGEVEHVSKVAPTNGVVGYAPGCTWFNLAGSTGVGFKWTNIGSFASATWLEDDPSSGATVQFGAGTATILSSGNIYRKVSGVGLTPASTAADIVVDVYSLPLNSLDGTGNRGLYISAAGNLAANGNTKECKIFFNATTAVIGSAVTGGTVIADTGASTGNNVGWGLTGQVFKYGAANSNTQIVQEVATVVGATHGGMGKASAITATENAAILIAVTINCTTTATDASLWWWEVTAYN